jgi:hypothetical protein
MLDEWQGTCLKGAKPISDRAILYHVSAVERCREAEYLIGDCPRLFSVSPETTVFKISFSVSQLIPFHPSINHIRSFFTLRSLLKDTHSFVSSICSFDLFLSISN